MQRAFVMRGLPGSGKSLWISNNLPQTQTSVASADNYRIGSDGIYRYNKETDEENHLKCLLEFQKYLQNGVEYVVCDNTNVRMYELAPYYKLAQAMQYKVEIVHLLCTPETAIRRNVHNVPEKTILNMMASFDSIPPWFVVRYVLGE